jgi:hypothetical protein
VKLWLLEPVEGVYLDYDYTWRLVIRAPSEDVARQMAQGNARYEDNLTAGFWTDPTRSRCVELHQDGAQGIIITDFRAG